MGRLHEGVTEGIKGRAARPGGSAVIGARRFCTVRAGRGEGGMAVEGTERAGGDGGVTPHGGAGHGKGGCGAGRGEGGGHARGASVV